MPWVWMLWRVPWRDDARLCRVRTARRLPSMWPAPLWPFFALVWRPFCSPWRFFGLASGPSWPGAPAVSRRRPMRWPFPPRPVGVAPQQFVSRAFPMRELLPRRSHSKKLWPVSLAPVTAPVTFSPLREAGASRACCYGKTRIRNSRISAISAAQTACAMGYSCHSTAYPLLFRKSRDCSPRPMGSTVSAWP